MSEINAQETKAGTITNGSFFRQLCNVSQNTLPLSFPQECSLDEAFSRWADANIPEGQKAQFHQLFSPQALKKAHAAGKSSVSFEYDDPENPSISHRFVLHLSEDDETGDVLCVGTISDRAKSADAVAASGNSAGSRAAIQAAMQRAVSAAVEDLQLEMRMERTETKKKHRRAKVLIALFFLLVGVVCGAVLDRVSPVFSDFVGQFFPSEEVEVEEPEEIPEPEEVEVPETVTEYVAFTEPVTFTAEVMQNGTARVNTSSESYDSIVFTASAAELLDPAFFEENYAEQGIVLNGTEAAVRLDLSFEDPGDNPSVNPQDAFSFQITDADGNVLQSYQLTDAPAGGSYGSVFQAGEPVSFYKRFDYSENAEYLILTYYQEGIRHDLYFALHSVETEAEPDAAVS